MGKAREGESERENKRELERERLMPFSSLRSVARSGAGWSMPGTRVS